LSAAPSPNQQNRRWEAVLSDIDGTLLGSDRRVTDATAAAVQALVRDGVLFALVTGRMPGGVESVMGALGVRVPRVCYSGALVLDADGTALLSKTIALDTAQGVLNLIRDEFPQLSPCYFAGTDWFVEDAANNAVVRESVIVEAKPQETPFAGLIANGVLPNKLFCSCIDHVDLSARLKSRLNDVFDDLNVIRSTNGVMLEIIPNEVDKATGARALLDAYAIHPSRALAFGDDANDVALLRMAGKGVAVANASPCVREAADDLAPPATQDGVARYLARLGLTP